MVEWCGSFRAAKGWRQTPENFYSAGTVWIIETKGREELDLPQKMARLRLWSADATAASVAESGVTYRFIYVDQKGFEKHPPGTFAALAASFTEYQRE